MCVEFEDALVVVPAAWLPCGMRRVPRKKAGDPRPRRASAHGRRSAEVAVRREWVRRRLADPSLDLQSAVSELGFRSYGAMSQWCARHLGARPKELHSGSRQAGPVPRDEPRAQRLVVRCTPAERDQIARALQQLAERLELPYGSAILAALRASLQTSGRPKASPRAARATRRA